MTDEMRLLDPTAEIEPVVRARLARPSSLEGLSIALLDIAKPRGDEFLDRIDELLRQRGFKVERFRKPAFSKVAPAELKQAIRSRCRVVIEALAD